MEVKELQSKLFNYNLVSGYKQSTAKFVLNSYLQLVDRMHTNHEVGDLELEARRAKESADELSQFSWRQFYLFSLTDFTHSLEIS